ncbi:putative hydrolase/coenzyme F420 biosynthesis associated uncharacterized protein [Stackebrandtia albiflava]|uniref:Putative hydrolase/coenzyme F420 biosynthesis associated uncharacterized protein n=1 Tax=Stackebrandtia albiflava TaxID=406432 RepID=A0A562V2U3_9ACTN|nr:zinc-dependent metalloprotease [Stackebrandtia albiflava]TWJ12175.1 putative hydrolase/coenzyme F420 biosynthesis associated uncharacterized protein [Stackebrandtia albiflava]
MTQFVDWELATATARRLGTTGPSMGLEEAVEEVRRLRDDAERATVHVAEFTSLTPRTPPVVRVVDRADWSAANVVGLRTVLDPLAHRVSGEPGPLARSVGSRVAGAQIGAVLGYLSGKILGQFEIFGDSGGQLLLVVPNIVTTQRELDADPAEFRMWVCLHEAAHAAQFGAVPWLRDHFLAEVDRFAAAESQDGPDLRERVRRGAALLAESVKDPDSTASVIDLVGSPVQREVMERLTAFMTLLEGHADYVMDSVGPQVIPNAVALRRRMDHRRREAGVAQRLIRRLLGMDVKLRQYTQGRAFVDAVVGSVGMERFNRVWEASERLPTMAEILSPDDWVRRVAD